MECWSIIQNMKYIYLTFQYLFKIDKGKRFLSLLFFAIPSCLVLAYYFPITGYFEWFMNYTGDYSSYSALWLSLVERDSLKLGLLLLGYILLIFSVSAIATLTIRSVRIGKFQIKNPFYLINENFFPSFYLMTFFMISLIIVQSLVCLFLFLWQTLPGYTLGYILSILIMLISLFFTTFIYSGMCLWLPLMSINGLRPFKAIGITYSKTHKERKLLFVTYLLAMSVIVLIGFIAYIFRDIWYIKWLINTANYAIATVFFAVLSILSYFEIEGIAREDLIKRPYLRR